MKAKKTISLFILLCLNALSITSQNVLHYVSDNICLDDLINVNTGLITHVKNLVVEDLNNTGNKEVIVTDELNNLIKIYSFSATTGSFTFQNSINVSNNGGFGAGMGKLQAVAAGNFTNDQLMDIVFTTSDSIFIYKHNAASNFAFSLLSAVNIPSAFKGQEHYLKVDNIDNTGNDEFYFLSSNFPSFPGITVMPFLNVAGNFNPAASRVVFKSAGSLIGQSMDISTGDIKGDNDGLKDLMITYSAVKDSVFFLENNSIANSILLNTLGVRIVPTLSFTPDFAISSSEVVDLNGDNKLDFIFYGISNFTSAKIAIYAGTNSFTLNTNIDIPIVGFDIHDFKFADINNDNKRDFVGVGKYSSTTFSGLLIYPGNANATSYLNQSIGITFTNNIMSPDEIQLSDVDNNGLNDIIIKPWKGNIDRTYMIPNFSYKVTSSATPSAICGAFPATIAASISATVPTNYNWEYASPTGTFSTIPPTTSSFTTSIPGFYKAYVDFNMYNPNNTCTLVSDTLEIISNAPVITVSSQNTTVCYGDYATTSASGAATYTWVSPSASPMFFGPTFSIQVVSSTVYTVTGQLTNGCKGTNTVSFNLHPLNTDVITASKNPACIGDAVSLSMPSAATYTWSNGSNNAITTVTPVVTSIYSLAFADANGCASAKSLTIDIDPKCNPRVYNGITVNGDGNNDFFEIENIEKFKNNSVKIYNRWGKEIFTVNNYDNKTNYWPTPEHLKTLVPSTYFYVINYGEDLGMEKGWVELMTN